MSCTELLSLHESCSEEKTLCRRKLEHESVQKERKQSLGSSSDDDSWLVDDVDITPGICHALQACCRLLQDRVCQILSSQGNESAALH